MFESGNGGCRKSEKKLAMQKLQYVENENKHIFTNTYKTIISIKKEQLAMIGIFHIENQCLIVKSKKNVFLPYRQVAQGSKISFVIKT